MTASPIRVLLIEDNLADVRLIQAMAAEVETITFQLVYEPRLSSGLSRLQTADFDLMLLDLGLPDSQGLETFAKAERMASYLPIIVLTGYSDERLALEAVRAGAQDYLVKGEIDSRLLTRAMRHAIERKQIEQERAQALVAEQEQRLIAETLGRIGLALSATLNLPELLALICHEAMTFYGATAASVWLMQGSELVQLITVEPSSTIKNDGNNDGKIDGENGAAQPLADFERVVARVIATGEPVRCNNAAELAEFGLVTGSSMQPLLCIPLVREDRTIGALMIQERQNLHHFTEADVRIAQVLGSHAAITIENARLFVEAQSQARQIQQILDTVPEGIFLLDSERRIMVANPLAQEYLTLLGGVSVGDQLVQLGAWPLDQLPLGAERITGIELMVADTPPRIFEIAVCPLVYLESRQGWILLVREVTKERERQSYLRSQERLGTMGQMAAGIAHDFNNMLLVISLHIEMLYKNPATSKHQQYLETVMAQIQSATKLIKQMMDFGRRSMLQYSIVDLEEFAVTVQHLLRHTLPEHIQIEFTCAPGEYFIRADRTYLEQVLLNLSLNARDAMPRGGFLRMALDTVTFSDHDAASLPALLGRSWHRFTVADTGTGIAPENVTHIFEPFFTTKGPDEGTGLGLAQVYGIIKQHGGEISVESEVGRGTRFTLYFPATSEAAHPMEESPVSAALGGHEMILVVEDESSLRNAVQEVLSDLGYHVLLASDGLEAEAIVEQMGEQIQLVVSDMVMPRMGGVQLYQMLKSKNPSLPIILTTGYPLDTAGRELLMQEPVDWLQKPYMVNTLAKHIRAMLDK